MEEQHQPATEDLILTTRTGQRFINDQLRKQNQHLQHTAQRVHQRNHQLHLQQHNQQLPHSQPPPPSTPPPSSSTKIHPIQSNRTPFFQQPSTLPLNSNVNVNYTSTPITRLQLDPIFLIDSIESSDILSDSIKAATSMEAKLLESALHHQSVAGHARLKHIMHQRAAAAGVRLRARIISSKVRRGGHTLLDSLSFFDVYGWEGMSFFVATVALWVSPLYLIISIVEKLIATDGT